MCEFYMKVGNAITETLERAGEPLTETQKAMLIGGLAVWLVDDEDNGEPDIFDSDTGLRLQDTF